MVTFWCRACNSEHDNGRDCPYYVDMRGSKESGNRKYDAKGAGKRCSRGCKTSHPDNLCPKNRKSIMHPSNKKARDAKTHKESKKHDKLVKKDESGCFGVIVVVTGGAAALIYGLLEAARAIL